MKALRFTWIPPIRMLWLPLTQYGTGRIERRGAGGGRLSKNAVVYTASAQLSLCRSTVLGEGGGWGSPYRDPHSWCPS